MCEAGGKGRIERCEGNMQYLLYHPEILHRMFSIWSHSTTDHSLSTFRYFFFIQKKWCRDFAEYCTYYILGISVYFQHLSPIVILRNMKSLIREQSNAEQSLTALKLGQLFFSQSLVNRNNQIQMHFNTCHWECYCTQVTLYALRWFALLVRQVATFSHMPFYLKAVGSNIHFPFKGSKCNLSLMFRVSSFVCL